MKVKAPRRLVTTTAIVGVTAALLVAPANARFVDPDSGGTDSVASATVGSPLGLTGDSPLTRVSAPEPEGLTGDGALTRAGSRETSAASTGERDWALIGIGSGGGALLLAAFATLFFSNRARERHVAMP